MFLLACLMISHNVMAQAEKKAQPKTDARTSVSTTELVDTIKKFSKKDAADKIKNIFTSLGYTYIGTKLVESQHTGEMETVQAYNGLTITLSGLCDETETHFTSGFLEPTASTLEKLREKIKGPFRKKDQSENFGEWIAEGNSFLWQTVPQCFEA